MDDRIYRGFHRTDAPSGLFSWHGTQDDQLLLGEEPEQVSFAITYQELLEELRSRYPEIELQYGYVLPYIYFDQLCVYTYCDPGFCPRNGFDAADLNRLRELVQKYKRVRCSIIWCYPEIKSIINLDPELYIDHSGYARRKPGPARARGTQAVTVMELMHISKQLVQELTSPDDPVGIQLRLDAKWLARSRELPQFLGRYDILVSLLGVRRVQRSAAFQQLLKQWRAAESANVKKWGQQGPHADRLLKLLNKPLKPVPV